MVLVMYPFLGEGRKELLIILCVAWIRGGTPLEVACS